MERMKRIVECVPNFSEGRDAEVIGRIVEAIRTAEADGGERVEVLHVDAGEAANRTVVTFMGTVEAVCEAAFRGVQTAGELIDMRLQHGTHPRIGATDVLPLVPLSGITLEECAMLARRLAERIYRELGIPCYCYEAAAFTPERRNLAVCRAGEYESLPAKMDDPLRRPDFGPAHYDERTARTGASVVGARNLLIAVNFNLNTQSASLAQEIACDVREKGRKVDGTWVRGTLKGCKAIGWYIEEYGIAQVSMNITDIHATPLHKAYEEVCRAAAARGARITGTEIIGLVPRSVLVEAGRYFAVSGERLAVNESMELAIRSMHLDDLRPFNIDEKTLPI
ncbi:MAG: glutamate formimidoyltransferase [Bacteroidaceae bacterium]|nr:glutamate formimidoyltransferase [Bacteroidaceae bacterium]